MNQQLGHYFGGLTPANLPQFAMGAYDKFMDMRKSNKEHGLAHYSRVIREHQAEEKKHQPSPFKNINGQPYYHYNSYQPMRRNYIRQRGNYGKSLHGAYWKGPYKGTHKRYNKFTGKWEYYKPQKYYRYK